MTATAVELHYAPCVCSPESQPRHVVRDADGVLHEVRTATATPHVEFFDQIHVAAARFRQLVNEGKPHAVHHRGLHVVAATIDGVRWE